MNPNVALSPGCVNRQLFTDVTHNNPGGQILINAGFTC